MQASGGVVYADRASRRRELFTVLIVMDAVALVAASLLAAWIRFGAIDAAAGLSNISGDVSYYELAGIVALLWLGALWMGGLYDLERLTWGSGEFSRIIRALSFGVVVFIVATYALKTPGLSRAWTILAFCLAVVLVSFERLMVRSVLRYRRRRNRFMRRTVIVGCNAEGCDIIRVLSSHPESGLAVAGLLLGTQEDADSTILFDGPIPVLGTARDVKSVVAEQDIDTVVIATSAFSHDVVSRIVNELRGMDVTIHLSSGLFEILTSRMRVGEVAGVPLITVSSVSFSKGQRRTKRAFDVIVAGLGIIVALPIWVLLAGLVKFTSAGPVFYRQPRVGRDGEAFGMYKFRSMVADADQRLADLQSSNEATGPLFKMKDDPRVTTVGKWMRKFSIDEFPQLINVMRGEMSLVGPRPPLAKETAEYTDYHWRRMEVAPGMTGLWQVSGRSTLTFEEMVRLDLFYIENWSVGFDLALLARTAPAVLLGDGAY